MGGVCGPVALLLALAGGGLALAAALTLGGDRFLGRPPRGEEQPALVFRGPYAFCAHPFDAGIALLAAAMVAAYPSPATAVVTAGVWSLLLALARREERANLERFGEAYRRYLQSLPCRRVLRRLCPPRGRIDGTRRGL